jgi:hypothetical protein
MMRDKFAIEGKSPGTQGEGRCSRFLKMTQWEAAMLADQVEVSWDAGKDKWMVRIVNGEEVIRRPCKLPKNANEQALRAAAVQTVQDEGYEADPALVSVRR